MDWRLRARTWPLLPSLSGGLVLHWEAAELAVTLVKVI